MKTNLLTSNQLKWIAIITMVIDHVGAFLFPEVTVLRIIGRISFPIFAFLIAEGLKHTKDAMSYLARLLVLAWISEPIFDLLIFGHWSMERQNIFFTLSFGLMMIMLRKKYLDGELSFWNMYLNQLIVIALTLYVVPDYSWYGILLICFFYEDYSKFSTFNIYLGITCIYAMMTNQRLQLYSMIALVPIFLYSGLKGRSLKTKVSYLVYPVHLAVIYLITLRR